MVPVACEELECVVCFDVYSRSDRIPRMLYCRHTFCSVCLETMACLSGMIRTVTCPSADGPPAPMPHSSLPGALWVNTDIWDQISELKDKAIEMEQQETIKAATPKPSSLKLILSKVFRCVLQPATC